MTINGNSDGKLTTMITAAPALICLRLIEWQCHKLIISYYHIFNNSAFTMTHLFALSKVIPSEELWQLWQSCLLPTFASASSKDRNLNCCIWLDRSYCTLATTIVVFLSLMIIQVILSLSDHHLKTLPTMTKTLTAITTTAAASMCLRPIRRHCVANLAPLIINVHVPVMMVGRMRMDIFRRLCL